ncbi:cold shock domain-containing protein [Serratia ureilytica]|nr:cold shock domain-containing protein [Serratia ureilytica]
MIKGQVKWFNEAKGFGFITPARRQQRRIRTLSAIQDQGFKTLAEGQNVQFSIENGGIQAAYRSSLPRRTVRRSYGRSRRSRSQRISDRRSPDGFWCLRCPEIRRGWTERCIPTGRNRSVGQ